MRRHSLRRGTAHHGALPLAHRAGVYLLVRVAGRPRAAAYLAAISTALLSPSILFMKNMRADSGVWRVPVRFFRARRAAARSSSASTAFSETIGQREVPAIKPCHATIPDMRATIELPKPVFHLLQARAEQRSSTIQAVILEAIQEEITLGSTPAEGRGRVSLPLIRPSHPGSLHSLTNTQIDDILG